MDRVKALFALLLACLMFPSQGRATTLNELKVGVRVLDFLTQPLRGHVAVAVIYDGSSKPSTDDAQAIQGWLNSGVSSTKASLEPNLVDARQLGASPPFQVALLAAGTVNQYGRIYEWAERNHAVLISADPECAYDSKCTISVSSSPRVEVVLNRHVAETCGVEFTEAFRMMVREY